MSTSTDPLKTTTSGLHRFRVMVHSLDQWYAVIRECRSWFNKEWSCQGNVRKKLNRNYRKEPLAVWFDVPDPRWATWIATKLALQVCVDSKYKER
jgi:hypothetical protein